MYLSWKLSALQNAGALAISNVVGFEWQHCKKSRTFKICALKCENPIEFGLSPRQNAKGPPNSEHKTANALDFGLSALQTARSLANLATENGNALGFWLSTLQNARALAIVAS
jgi:LAS superfamily LD-carboxypeptidase LdcB